MSKPIDDGGPASDEMNSKKSMTKVSPQHIAMLAKSMRKKRRSYVCLSEYGEAIVTLRDEKGLTLSEIQEWLATHKISASLSSITKAYRRRVSELERAQSLVGQLKSDGWIK